MIPQEWKNHIRAFRGTLDAGSFVHAVHFLLLDQDDSPEPLFLSSGGTPDAQGAQCVWFIRSA
jgi:hypothetical protein